jgi:tetratricopeptide (TPR) repeat protein
MIRVVEIFEKSLGGNHPQVATALNNLAMLYKATNRLSEAEPLMIRVVEIFEKSLGKDHPNVATALNNLALFYQATNRFPEAEPLMKRALAIWEKSLGGNHPQVATALNNLAQLYQATNRLSEAEPLMKRQLVIFLQFTHQTGHPHPHLDAAISNYTSLLKQMGHNEDQITERLKRLDPEMFKSRKKEK